MALATQCPHCHTAFRVANDQLKLHAGLVRCGACQQTFNGIEHLLAPGQGTEPVANTIAQAPSSTPVSDTAIAEISATPAVTAVETTQKNSPPDSPDLPESLEFDLGDEPKPQTASNYQTEDQTEDQTAAQAAESNSNPKPDQELDQEHDLELEIGQYELETRSTLMNQSDSDWSVSESQEDQPQDSLAAIPPAEDLTQVERGDRQTYERKEPVYSDLDLDAMNAASISDALSDDLNAKLSDEADDKGAQNDDDIEHHLEKPDFVVKAEKKQKRSKVMRFLQAFLALVLLLALLAQATYTLRDTIAAWFPQAKPTLQDICLRLHCQIALPSQIEMISIESNELEAIDAGRKVFSLALQLQNKSGTLQNWPMLELTLNDGKGKALLQKVFTPDEYLPNKSDLAKGFSAGSEQSVKLFFELSGIKASGYHVGVFYP